VTAAGNPLRVASDGWRAEPTVRQAQTPCRIRLAGKVYREEELVSTPTLSSRIGQRATIAVGDSAYPFTLSMVVTPPSPDYCTSSSSTSNTSVAFGGIGPAPPSP